MMRRDEILKWIKKKTGPPAETVESVAALEDVKEKEEVFLLGYFESFEVSCQNFQVTLSYWKQSRRR